MSKSTLCDVYVRLQHGIIIDAIPTANGLAMDSNRMFLDHGVNENVPRERIQAFLERSKNLACVRRGDIRILDHDVLAVDSSKSRK
jgi:hypothetical protein